MSPLVSPTWHGNSVTHWVTHASQTKPVMKHFIQLRFRLTQALKNPCTLPRTGLSTPLHPPQTWVALARCRQHPGAPEPGPALAPASPAQTLVIPHKMLLPKLRLSRSQEVGGKPSWAQRMGAGGPRWPHSHHPPHGDRKVALVAILMGYTASPWGAQRRERPRAKPSVISHKAALISALKQHRNFITLRQLQAGFSSLVPLFIKHPGRPPRLASKARVSPLSSGCRGGLGNGLLSIPPTRCQQHPAEPRLSSGQNHSLSSLSKEIVTTFS